MIDRKITEKGNNKNRPQDNEVKVKKGVVVNVLMYWPYCQGNCRTAYATQFLRKCKYFRN